MDGLEVFTIDDIFAELKKRFRGVLLVTEAVVKESDDKYETFVSYCGGANIAIGLAHRAIDQLTNPQDYKDDDDADQEAVD